MERETRGMLGMGEPPRVGGQGGCPAGDFPSGGAEGNWVHWEPAVGEKKLGNPAIQPSSQRMSIVVSPSLGQVCAW